MNVTLNMYAVNGCLAGEYPGSLDERVAELKLELALSKGVTLFIDLTESHELEHYQSSLGERARYARFPIVDGSVPSDSDIVRQVLSSIDAELGRGGVPYIHCWGGIGRTGLIVGCWLVSQGMTGTQALDKVQELYATTPKVHRLPRSPENDSQRDYVTRWATNYGLESETKLERQ